ncbi:MAG: hypothetical protein GKR89_31180 [Candidatus Latescibacteria bacterium]|nr:hypothetical protein [Candidatus Latescibacterota bacterium]
MSRSSRALWVVGVLVLGSCLVAVGAKLQLQRWLVLENQEEQIRSAPKGEKVGVLLEGARVEEVERDGKWVKVRLEGWMWGPSFEDYTATKAAPSRPVFSAAEAEVEQPSEESDVRLPLQEKLPAIRYFIDEEYGVFYGLALEEITRRLVVRLRVKSIDREGLERRQMAIQFRVLEELQEAELGFETVRIESNRPDGSGQVGTEIAETAVADIRLYGEGDVETWRAQTRLSTDGGETWSQ